jgi:hypothetical protein
MTVYLARGFGAALIYAFAAQGAFAELTAQDVWRDWRSYVASTGYEITGTEMMSGDTLTVADLSMTTDSEEFGAAITISLPLITFTEIGDGTVRVGIPASFPIRAEGKGEDGEEFAAVMDFSQNGLSIMVSGSPNDVVYTYSAASMDVALSSVSIDGETLPASFAQASVSLTNVASTSQIKTASLRSYDEIASADSLNFAFAFTDAESGDTGKFSGAMQGLNIQANGDMPLNMDTSDIRKLLNKGFGIDTTFSYASGSTNIQGAGDGETFAATTASQGGSVNVVMNASDILYGFSQKGSSISITTDQLPFPISLDLAEASFQVGVPVAQSDQEQDFSLALTLANFTMADMLWGIFDPAAVLPRDPATVAIEVSGKAKVLLDMFDPEVIDNLDSADTPPGELNALTINKLLISMVGARLSGNGDFTFDNSDLETFDGLPAPTGFVELTLVGANGLLDKLIQMGFISDQDAIGGRMMMGLLAVPGDGPDTLNSRIEITADGQISANGQRIK